MKLYIITGQTATGKTSLALDLAQKFKGVLINSDARQVYKFLDIITGKDKNLFKESKIWLYDIVKPDQYFSSFDYVNLAIPLIKELQKSGLGSILVGGTYLYLKHLLYGVKTVNIPPDFKLRKKLQNKTREQLQEMLKKVDSNLFQSLNNSEKNNPQRLIRKIEISASGYSGKQTNPGSQEKLSDLGYDLEMIGLKFKAKENLRKTIAKRVEQRLQMGALTEVKEILRRGYEESDPGLKTIGYQQLILYLKGVISLEEAVQMWINKEVQYAKRQYTFMKKDKNIRWREV